MGLITKIISKQARVINKLGRFGTGVPLAPVLLFELYLANGDRAVNRQHVSRSGDS